MKDWYFSTFSPLLADVERGLHQFAGDHAGATPLFREMIDHHFGWTGDAGKGGKRIRPLLVMLVARALTGSHAHALPAAVGVELVHNFTLVHDDVMDRSTERRHRPTLWARWGMAQAINAGDGLYALGMASLLRLAGTGVEPRRVLAALDALLAACVATVEGQMLDVSFETRLDVTPDEYLAMIAGKTGALLACSTRLGALLSTDDATAIEAYATFGLHLGLAFQIWDDYLGIWGDVARMGKSATGDIETKKKSYPVLVALARADAGQLARIRDAYARETLDADDVRGVLDILNATGAAEETRRLLDLYFHRALDALDALGVDNEDQRHLRELALFLVERAY